MKSSTKYQAGTTAGLILVMLLDLAIWIGVIWAVAKLLTVL